MNPKFYEIFSKRPQNIIKDSPKIIADYREKNSLVISKLIKLGCQVEIIELKVGDYISNSTVVERKTINDFLSSIKNKRLSKQLEELQQYKNRLLIIEGFEKEKLYDDSNPEGINPNAIRGFLLSTILKHNTPIIFTKDEEDTARYLLVLAKKKETEASLNAKKKALNKKEQMQFILESFPNIGPKTAKKLLEEFSSLEKIFAVDTKELEKLIGKKSQVFKILKEKY
jgi:ERCC4-type nuclease